MSVSQDLGKVSVTPKGVWSSDTAYHILDIVTSGGSSYLAKLDAPAGTALNNTTYWMLLAGKGDTGEAGTTTWSGITDKPAAFPPSAHTHDDRYYTETETDALLDDKQDKPVIKTTLDSVLTPMAQYYLGEQSALTLTLPTTGLSAGQEIVVVFYSGSTATTLNVVGDFLGTAPTIAANRRGELNFLYDGTNWSLVSGVAEVPQDEVSA